MADDRGQPGDRGDMFNVKRETRKGRNVPMVRLENPISRLPARGG